MVRGDGSQHFVELIDIVEVEMTTFICRVGHCLRTTLICRALATSMMVSMLRRKPQLTRIQRTLRLFPGICEAASTNIHSGFGFR